MATQSVLRYLYEQTQSQNENLKERFIIPTTKDFTSTEIPLSYDTNSIDINRALYYIERPYSDTPGYYPEDEVMIVKGRPSLSNEHLGSFDSDTLYFDINKIDDNNATIYYNGSTFTIKDYLQKMSGSFGDGANIGIRFVGVNSPETNKYKTLYKSSINESDIISVTKQQIERDTQHAYIYDEYTDSYLNDTMKFVYKKVNNEMYYCQITEDTRSIERFDSDTNTSYIDEVEIYKYLYNKSDPEDNKNSHLITQAMIDLIGDNECTIMIDHNMLNSKSDYYPTTYEDYDDDTLINDIRVAIASLYSYNNGFYYPGFSGYGQDGYGRFLGCLYVKTLIPGLPTAIQEAIGEQWINVTKYLLFKFGQNGIISHDIEFYYNEKSPTYTSQHNFISSAFKIWTYDTKQYVILDALDNISMDGINKQRELQKHILGFDFDSQLKDWTVMIGDLVFLVPPTSIRCVTRNNSESVPLIRSRGSAIKELPQSERIIEMSLYFNDEDGINGVELETPAVIFEGGVPGETRRFDEYTLAPVYDENGNEEKIKYYMNGLRALISMFKLCPFMPITNTYINDTLNVDAVALMGLTISTMPNYPKCITASLQLLEFNYHAYMSELPLTGDESAETIMSTNIFEKCIDFESLRYYYQKPLYRGEVVSRYAFDSPEYLNLTYGSKTALQPMKFGDSSVELYIPDVNHLNKLLQAKLESIRNPIKTQYSITDDAKEWAADIGKLYPYLQDYIQSDEFKELQQFILHGPVDKNGEHHYSLYNISGFAVSNMSYEDYCALNEYGDDFNKYQARSDNSYLSKYYTSGTLYEHICWVPDQYDGSSSGIIDIQKIPIHFNFSEMLYDSFLEYLPNDIVLNITHENNIAEKNNKICTVNVTVESMLSTNIDNITNLIKNMSSDIGTNYSEYFTDNGFLALAFSYSYNEATKKITSISLDNSDGYTVVLHCFQYYTLGLDTDSQFELPSDVMQDTIMSAKQDTDVDTNSSFSFVKYPNDDLLQSLVITNISSSFNNNLSRVYLKALDGYAPQYLGGQDTVIELIMSTDDRTTVAAINLLPKLCAEYMRNYRLILSCCPLRINTAFTRMLGVNEVLIESVDVSTVPNQPGIYQISMRLISVDRTVRNKEALKKLDINNAGSRTTSNTQTFTVRDYFDIKNQISAAEIYPDLELPTISELEIYGFNFIKYKLQETGRIYPDPDFYFVYGATVTNKILRDSILENLDTTYNTETKPVTFKFSDYFGGQLNVNVATDGDPAQLSVDPDSLNATAQNESDIVADTNDIIDKYNAAINNLYASTKEHEFKTSNSYWSSDNRNVTAERLGIKYHFKTINDITSFINLISNLDDNQFWNFSSTLKGLLREPNYANQDSLIYLSDYITADKDLIQLIIDDNDETYGTSNVEYDDYSFRGIAEVNGLEKLNDANNNYRHTITSKIYYIMHDHYTNDYSRFSVDYNIILAIADSISGTQSYNDDDDTFNEKGWQFNCFTGTDYRLVPIYASNSSVSNVNDIINSAYSFSAFSVRQYSGSYLNAYFKETLSAFNIDTTQLLSNKLYFLNPWILQRQHAYYTRSGDYGDDVKDIIDNYKYNLLYSTDIIASEAIVNIIMYHLMLIYNGTLISMYQLTYEEIRRTGTSSGSYSDIIDSNRTESLYTDGKGNYCTKDEKDNDDDDTYKNCNTEIKCTQGELESYILARDEYNKVKSSSESQELFEQYEKEYKDSINTIVENSSEILYSLLENMKRSYASIENGNMAIVATVYLNGMGNEIYNNIVSRDYIKLNDLLTSSKLPIYSSTNILLYKFFLALAGRDVIKSIEDIGSYDYAPSNYATSIIDEMYYLEQINDPYTYTRDSFYDMVTSDMRGRMCRAFPTFYMLFVDEGREIGLWKLNDNFYNMSSISEIQITKSRKIAADTCTIQMTNMYKTFTTDDEDGKEMAYDLETLASMDTGFADLWDSIFSPRKLFLRDYRERIEQNPIDRAQLRPGVRIHVRMGYGGDAYSLPTVFNGVVAEVTTGELVTITCQGDGVELTNPILDNISSEDIVNYESLPIVKQIQNWLTKGATPRTILSKFITTKGNWLRNAVRSATSGRFFNENPFGITHFGDPDYKAIFGTSECTQNIYEAERSPRFNSGSETYLTNMQYLFNSETVPLVSTQIAGKTYWDIMQVMAAVSTDFVASVVPFGMRSSVFYGLPHYYYAYEYIKDRDGLVKEKRKPFQQYHIYTSYSDIIENNITTSAKYMKTNAIGLYYQNGSIFGDSKTKKVGPVFTDIDIYPEYQKSMTVDTTFISQGIPLIGDIIPFLNSLTTDLEWFYNDDESIAYRITARALKDATKEMYQGELITIGDPSVKPYDIMYLHDVYENMQGGCEVEAVTHILNSQTGFTSSIYADPMVDIDNRYYQTAYMLSKYTIGSAILVYSSVFGLTCLLGRNTQPITKIAAKYIAKGTNIVADGAEKILGLLNLDDDITNKVSSVIRSANIFGATDATLQFDNITEALKLLEDLPELGDFRLATSTELAKVTQYINNINDIDPDYLLDLLNGMSEKLRTDEKYSSIYDDLITGLTKIKTSKTEITQSSLSEIFDAIKAVNINADAIDSDVLKAALGVIDDGVDLTKSKNITKYTDALRDILENLDELGDSKEAIQDALGAVSKKLVTDFDDVVKGADGLASALGVVGDAAVHNADDVASALKKISFVARGSKLAFTLLNLALEMLIEVIICGTVNNAISRWMRNLETLRIYPLMKNEKVYTAGLSGSRGIVMGSSTYDTQGWIQKYISDFFDNHPIITGFVVPMIIGDVTDMTNTIERWRRGNGMAEPDSQVGNSYSTIQTLASQVGSNMSVSNNSIANGIILDRIKTLTSDDDVDSGDVEEAVDVFASLFISNEYINYNDRINNLVLLQDIKENIDSIALDSDTPSTIFDYYHNRQDIQTGTTIMNYNSQSIDVPYYVSVNEDGVDYNDYPLVCGDLSEILRNFVLELKIKYPTFHNELNQDISTWITSALIPGYTSSWHSTGYSVDFIVNNVPNEVIVEILDNMRSYSNDIFVHSMSAKKANSANVFNITVYPPVDKTITTANTLATQGI